MPRVSIGLPVYNGERYLAEALDALLAQTFDDFEVVVCDNASTDRTPEISRDYAASDPRIRVHRNAENLGAAPNFNLAFELASGGEYFKWAAHDDLVEPELLAECVRVLDADPTVILCHGEAAHIDEASRRVPGYAPEPLPHVGSRLAARRFANLVWADHWCVEVFGVMRRHVLAQTPLIGSFAGSDRTLLAELGLRGRFVILPRVLFLRRQHPGRSVNTADLRARARWFDTKQTARLALPYWRYLREYVRAVQRCPLSPQDRLLCYAALADWLRRYRSDLAADLLNASRHGLRRRHHSRRD